MTYKAGRGERYEYAYEAIESIEQNSCILGCLDADQATEDMPGGCCNILVTIATGDSIEIPEIDDLGKDGLFCRVRKPL